MRTHIKRRRPRLAVIMRNGDARMPVAGLHSDVNGLAVVRDPARWIIVALGGRIRNRPNLPGDAIVFRDDQRVLITAAVVWNVSGSIGSDRHVAVQTAALRHSI